jgi:hypothetical protein
MVVSLFGEGVVGEVAAGKVIKMLTDFDRSGLVLDSIIDVSVSICCAWCRSRKQYILLAGRDYCLRIDVCW